MGGVGFKLSAPQEYILTSTKEINLFLAGVGCFVGETLVRTDKGLRPIKDIESGERVLSVDVGKGTAEFMPVLETFKYRSFGINQDCVIFTTRTSKIVCTENHEFYFRGTWTAAGDIARRIMARSSQHAEVLLCEQHGATTDNRVRAGQRKKPKSGDNEDGENRQRVFWNVDKARWSDDYGKHSPPCCSGVDTKPNGAGNRKPQRPQQEEQRGFKFGVDDAKGQYGSLLQNSIAVGVSGGRPSRQQVIRSGSYGNSAGGKSRCIRESVSGKIRCIQGDDFAYCQPKELAACSIELSDILVAEIVSLDVDVYDLCVQKNHNYCITEENILVHNSGKTHLGGLVSGTFIQRFPHIRGFIGANFFNQLNTSTMLRIREVWKELFNWEADRDYVVGKQPPKGFSMEGHNFDRYDGIVSFKNGAIVFIGSLDNAKAHDGKEFGWAILDETKDTREQDVKEVILTRMRQTGMDFQGKGFNPLYILTSPAKVQWLNEWFELDEYRAEIEGSIYSENTFFAKEQKNKCIAISSTYHNQINLPEGYIDRIKDNNPDERAKALIYANPFTKTGGEFYSSFSAARHVGRVEYKPELPIHISFDQNVVPYITATLWQVEQSEKGWDLRNFDEFCLPNPNNTSERLCEAIIAKYGDRCKSMFFYGDASGHSRSTKSEETDYQIVERMLRKWLHHGSDRTERKNPPVIKRRDFINNIFEGKTRWKILIDEACKKMVVDLTYIKQDPNGKKWKEKVKDEISGQTYEKYGHVGDSMDYIICEVAASDFERFCEG